MLGAWLWEQALSQEALSPHKFPRAPQCGEQRTCLPSDRFQPRQRIQLPPVRARKAHWKLRSLYPTRSVLPRPTHPGSPSPAPHTTRSVAIQAYVFHGFCVTFAIPRLRSIQKRAADRQNHRYVLFGKEASLRESFCAINGLSRAAVSLLSLRQVKAAT